MARCTNVLVSSNYFSNDEVARIGWVLYASMFFEIVNVRLTRCESNVNERNENYAADSMPK